MSEANRLPPTTNAVFGGHQIDRQRKLTFTLNGMRVAGFHGDTVLSALLAHPVRAAGTHLGHALALSEHFAPPVRRADGRFASNAFTPMAQTLAADQAAYEMAARVRSRPLVRLGNTVLRRRPDSLGVNFDDPANGPHPWASVKDLPSHKFDLIVVGGGVCGMSAALVAAQAGLRTALVERRPYLCGDAELFGSLEGENPPSAQLAALKAGIAVQDNLRVMVTAEAFDIADGALWIHLAPQPDTLPAPTIRKLESRKIILATGTADRLPVFSGNRLPGIMGLSEAFHLASAYGIWPRGETLIWGATNAIYRLGLLALDAGQAVTRILDARAAPQSRFREFAKAYGIQLPTGIAVDHASVRKQPKGLQLAFRLAWDEGNTPRETGETDRLVVANGWMPRLRLWRRAGGAVVMHDQGHFAASGSLAGVWIAGSAAGYQSMSGCMESGKQAVHAALGLHPAEVEDKIISELFETPDSPIKPLPVSETSAPAYFDSGSSLAYLQGIPPERRRRQRHDAPADGAGWLSPADVSGLVGLGRLDPADAPAVLDERAVEPWWVEARPEAASATTSSSDVPPPAFLEGRFGTSAREYQINGEGGRTLEPGSLVYTSSDVTDPAEAVGVILAPQGDRQVCLVSADVAEGGYALVVRGTGGVAHIALKQPPSPAGQQRAP